MKEIGKVVATEKNPTTIDEFFFWTNKDRLLSPFDVIKVAHIQNSYTYGVIEEISHITDSPSQLAGYISSDFGELDAPSNMERIGMNYVKAKVVGNTKNIYTPVLYGSRVSIADAEDVKEALGLNNVKNPLPCGYIEMYKDEDQIQIPVHFNSHFLIGPEGAHLNISGISGLASKTSYAMFLLKAIQDMYVKDENDESVAFVMLNVKGRDLLAIDELNDNKTEIEDEITPIYEMLDLKMQPFDNVKYFYPYHHEISPTTYAHTKDVRSQIERGQAFQFKYIFEDDREAIDLLFANIDDPQETMESIVNYISTGQGEFSNITDWESLKKAIHKHTQAGQKDIDKNITVASWRKFYRLFNKSYEKNKSLFATRCDTGQVRLQERISNIEKNDVFVIDIAKLDEETQGFVFGDVMRAIYDLKLGQSERDENEIPSKIVIFIDELNKYASKDVPKNSPILKQILNITERGRSLGIILFAAEQFKSDIHDRVKGNCSTHAYGRTNVIEISKHDYQYVPPVYKSMLTRLEQGQYILQNPIFRSLLNIKFPKPIYKQYKNG